MFLFLLQEIFRRKSLARALLNAELQNHSIHGVIVDVGGGKHQDYFSYLQIAPDTTIHAIDLEPRDAGTQRLDLERDPLPYTTDSTDHVTIFNVLEHIFHHQFVLHELYRALKPNGVVLGFVPFLVNYHPDPHDYFRYTKEALHLLSAEAGFRESLVKEIGRGPFAVNYNNVMLSVPLAVRALLFPLSYALDALFLHLRPHVSERYPLGYFFLLRK